MEPPMPAVYEQTVTVGRLRGEWRALLALSCNDALTGPRPQLVLRYDRPVAVIVSTGWYGQARKALGVTPEVRVVSSETARTELKDVLTDVDEHGCHVLINVDGYDVVAVVPVPWHQFAVLALAGSESSPNT
jgi:hypothetical protein